MFTTIGRIEVRMRRLVLVALLALGMTPAASANEVNLYTSNPEDVVAVVLDIVQEMEPGLRVNVITGGSGVLLRRIEAESGSPVADVFWSSGFSTLAGFRHLFEPYESPETEHIVPVLRASGEPWIGTNTHVMVFMVNQSQVGDRQVPNSWAALFSDEAWKGSVAFADPANSSASYAQLYGIFERFGEDGVHQLADVVAMVGGSGDVYRSVAQGEYPLGITMEYAAQRYVAGGQEEISLVYPEDGTMLSPEGLALIKDGPNPDNGKRLVDILLSKELQEAVFLISFRRPSRSDVSDAIVGVGLPAMDDIEIIEVDQEQAGAAYDDLLVVWEAARN
jgi:iron(III) transport system substrate-binding protein